MKYYYQLISTDLENRTGTVRVRTNESTEWTVINVALSYELVKRIWNFKLEQNNAFYKATHLLNTDSYLDTVFCSDINDPSYKKNPFTLIRFTTDDDNTEHDNYMLACAYQRPQNIFNKYSGKYERFTMFKVWKRAYWRRYWTVFIQDLEKVYPGKVDPCIRHELIVADNNEEGGPMLEPPF